MKNQLSALLEQEMDRKEFVRVIGVGMLMLMGGGVIANTLNNLVSPQKSRSRIGSGYTYGGSSYGGVSRH